MAHATLIKGNGNDNWYISDGVHKRFLQTVGSETREEQVAQLVLAGMLANSTPQVMDQDTVNAIVTV